MKDFLPVKLSRQKKGVACEALHHCVYSNRLNTFFASAHIQKNQLTNTGNDAFDFLGKRVFSEKIMTQSKKAAISKDRGHMFAVQRMKEKERFFFRFLTDFS